MEDANPLPAARRLAERAAVRMAIAVLAGVVGIAGVVAAAIHDGDSEVPGRTGGQTARDLTTTTSDAPTTSGDDAAEATDTTQDPGAGSTPVTNSSQDGDSSDPPETAVPAPTPGRYPTATEGSATISALGDQRRVDLPPETTTVVETSDDPQVRIIQRDLRRADGTGAVITVTFRYAPAGIELVALTVDASYGGLRQQQGVRPDQPQLLVPSEDPVGHTGQFTHTVEGVTAEVTSLVVERTTVRVGEDDRAAHLVEVQVSYSGVISGTQTTNLWVGVDDGMLLRDETNANGTAAGLAQAELHATSNLTRTSPT